MKTPALSFIIPVYHRLDLTRAIVDALRATAPGDDWEALIVDDGGTDDTAAFLATLEPPFRGWRLRENGGFARAVNRGAAEARGAVLGLINNDLLLSPGWLEPMRRLLATESRVGAVANVQMNPATGLVDHAGIFFDPEGMPTHAHKNRARPPRGRWRERNAATAACMLIPRAVFAELDGLHEGYRNGMEDVDFCVRLRQAGYRVLVSHESVVGHLVSSSPGRRDANDANTALFRERCAAIAAPWGRKEWPAEYFRRYARHWWRMNPQRALRAAGMLLGIRAK